MSLTLLVWDREVLFKTFLAMTLVKVKFLHFGVYFLSVCMKLLLTAMI